MTIAMDPTFGLMKEGEPLDLERSESRQHWMVGIGNEADFYGGGLRLVT